MVGCRRLRQLGETRTRAFGKERREERRGERQRRGWRWFVESVGRRKERFAGGKKAGKREEEYRGVWT